MDDEDGGLFNIDVSSDESTKESDKLPRDFQSEEDFQRQRAEWKPRIEVGEVCPATFHCDVRLIFEIQIWKTLKLPMENPSKPEAQTILYAIEELYFFRRYAEARGIADDALKGSLSEDFSKTVVAYRARCDEKLQRDSKQKTP